MPESATLLQGAQIGLETTPGTAVAANKKLLSLSVDPFAITNETTAFRPMGYKYSTIVNPTREWSTAGLSGIPDYNALSYLLAMIFGAPTITQLMDSATPTGAYSHVFTISSIAANARKTATIEQGNAAYTQRVAYALLNALSLALTRTEATLTGSLMAQRVEDAVVLTASPTEVAAIPIQPGTVDVYMDATWAGLGTTKLLRCLGATWGIDNLYGTVWPLNSAVTSFAADYETEPAATLNLVFANDATSRALITTMRAGGSKYVRVKATGPIIYDTTGTVNDRFYSLTLDSAAKINAGLDVGDQDGLATLTVPMTIVHDAGNAAMAATVINTLTAL